MTVFQGAVDATFAAFGIDAVYTPAGGEPVAVRVIARRPDAIVGFGDTRIHAETATFELRALRGDVHIFSRQPRALTVETAFVNAGTEGTEFLISTDERRTLVIVYEGLIRASNPVGEVLLTAREQAIEAGALGRLGDIASLVAPVIDLLSRISTQAVWLLEKSSHLVLRLLGSEAPPAETVTEEEVRMLIAEGTRTGVFHKQEQEMIGRVLRLGTGRCARS